MTQKNLRIRDDLAQQLVNIAQAQARPQGQILNDALTMFFNAPEDDRIDQLERRIARLEEMAGI